MTKRYAEIVSASGTAVAKFNETCHEQGGTVVTVRLASPLKLTGTESLALYAKALAEPVISVVASDPDGTEIHEFHGTSALRCLPAGTGVSLVRSPGGDLGTLLIVMGSGTVHSQSN